MLAEESRDEVIKELRLRYLIPKVTHIKQILSKPAGIEWILETDHGPIRFLMRNMHDHVYYPAPNRILITDMDGRRYQIFDYTELDKHSVRQFRKLL